MRGNEACSRDLVFRPQSVTIRGSGHSKSEFIAEIAIDLEGSAGIALAALLPYTLFGNIALARTGSKPAALTTSTTSIDRGLSITIKAGTLCVKAPSIHYLHQVWLPTLNMVGLGEFIHLDHHHSQGWHTDLAKFPGEIRAEVKPLHRPLKAFTLGRRGLFTKLTATATAPVDEVSMFNTILESEMREWFSDTRQDISQTLQPMIEIVMHKSTKDSPNLYHLLISAHSTTPEAHLGHENVYPRVDGFPAELESDLEKKLIWLARVTIKGLKVELRKGHAIDEDIQNMLVPYMVLAEGWSSVVSDENAKFITEIDHSAAVTSKLSRGPP